MQQFEILYNLSFTSNTRDILVSANLIDFVAQPVLYEYQQNLTLDQDYYSYLTRNGNGIVNDQNVKSFLDKPENETIAINFINYLTGSTTIDEFRDLFYDNKKLAQYFNDYYRKFINYSNSGLTNDNSNNNINLIETKNLLFDEDQKYLKTNSNTNYYAVEFDSFGNPIISYSNVTRTTDLINFSGYNENYYVNVKVKRNTRQIFTDDFSEYFIDKCDGNIIYTKYNYTNNFSKQQIYGNYNRLKQILDQHKIYFGPNDSELKYLKSLLPINYLRTLETQQSTSSDVSVNPSITLADGIYATNTQTPIINLPYAFLPNQQLSNFPDFPSFVNWFNWDYSPYIPNFSDPQQANKNWIYAQVISFVQMTNQLFGNSQNNPSQGNASQGNASQAGASGNNSGNNTQVDNLVKCNFSFINYGPVNNFGILYDPLVTNNYRLTIKHSNVSISEKVIIQYENFSASLLGDDNGINSFNLGIPNEPNLSNPQYILDFSPGEQSKDIFIKIYKDWGIRKPIVLSLRPFNNQSQICEYILIYLEEFYDLSNYTFSDQLNIYSIDKCKLIYNGFVDQKYDDNPFEFYRPDDFNLYYKNANTFIAPSSKITPVIENEINQKLLNIFGLSSINLEKISSDINIQKESIYNLYIYGSYFYGNATSTSDIDLILVVDSPEPLRHFKIGNIDYMIYNPDYFNFALNNVIGKPFPDKEITNDAAWVIFNTQIETFKILELFNFTYNFDKNLIKENIIKNSDSQLNDASNYFNSDLLRFQKNLWNSIRNLDFGIQAIKNNGKITNIQSANSYLNTIKNQNFQNFQEVLRYWQPKIENLKQELLSL